MEKIFPKWGLHLCRDFSDTPGLLGNGLQKKPVSRKAGGRGRSGMVPAGEEGEPWGKAVPGLVDINNRTWVAAKNGRR